MKPLAFTQRPPPPRGASPGRGKTNPDAPATGWGATVRQSGGEGREGAPPQDRGGAQGLASLMNSTRSVRVFSKSGGFR